MEEFRESRNRNFDDLLAVEADRDNADEEAAGKRNDAIIISGDRRRQLRPTETMPTWRQQASAMTRSSSAATGGDSRG